MIITHDLGVLSSIADQICVLYGGRVGEYGPTDLVLGSPRHPYTKGLMQSLPGASAAGEAMVPIQGAPPSLDAMPRGCAFHPRCEWAKETCRTIVPTLRTLEDGRRLGCDIDPFAAPEPTDDPSASNPSTGNPSYVATHRPATHRQPAAGQRHDGGAAVSAQVQNAAATHLPGHRCSSWRGWTCRICAGASPPCEPSWGPRSAWARGRSSAWWASRAAGNRPWAAPPSAWWRRVPVRSVIAVSR